VKNRVRSLAIICLAVLAIALPASAQTTHAFLWSASTGMQDLGTLPGDARSEAWAINASGVVAGESADLLNAHPHAFRWTSAGGMQDLGTLPNGKYSYAYGINTAGSVVGVSAISNVGMAPPAHAFLWMQSGGMQDLGTLPGGHSSAALAVNDSDQVVGDVCAALCDTLTPTYRGFIWTAATGMQDIGTLGGRSTYPRAINNAGQVVGDSNFDSSNHLHAFLWTAAGGMQDLGTTGPNVFSFATGINSAGNISAILNSGPERGASWTPRNGFHNIPPLGGVGSNWVANGINDLNHVVGSSWTKGPGPWHAYLWTKTGGTKDLGASLGGMNSYGNAVNASDQVAGSADIN
jgi:probable HAF family extracellular repeat protein